MSQTAVPTSDPNVIAALHQTGRVWRGVVVRRTNGNLELLESREFSQGEYSRIESWLEQHLVGRTICILPSSSIVCRTATLPDASPDQLNMALKLQADTQVQDLAPQHRRAIAVLHEAQGESNRSGLIVAWPDNGKTPQLPINRDVTFAPDIACLAALLNGVRTEEPMMWVDKTDGSVALVMSHSGGAVFRASCEKAESTNEWRGGIRRLLAETAYSVGHSDEFTDSLVEDASSWLNDVGSEYGKLLVPDETLQAVIKRIKGAKSDTKWWEKFGIATGALVATLDQLDSLTQLYDEEPIDKPSLLEKRLSKLDNRKVAIKWLIAAVLLLAFGSLLFSGFRWSVLRLRVGNFDEYTYSIAKREERLLTYEQLSKSTWPMSKLLADIANCAPEGITLDSIDLNETSNAVIIKGEAKRDKLVLQFKENLLNTKIFEEITAGYTNRDQSTKNYKLTVNAKVKNPFHIAEYEQKEDFAYNTLSMRLYGDRGLLLRAAKEESPTVEEDTAVTSNTPPKENTDKKAKETETATGGDPFGRIGPRSSRPPNIPSAATGSGEDNKMKIPEPLTMEEMSGLNRTQLLSKLGVIANLRKQKAFLSDEDKRTVEEQFKLMRDALKNVKEGN